MAAEQKMAEILLVEDDAGSARLTELAIAESRVEAKLTVARDGVEALSILRREGRHEGAPRPDLILLDLRLPKKGGREVLAEIRSDPEFRDIPVVVLSFSVYQEDMKRCYDLEANGYITKPIEAAQFVALMNSIEDVRRSLACFTDNRSDKPTETKPVDAGA